jgi:hypothetical protein
MNGPKRKRIYAMICRRDGEKCFIGGEPLRSESAVIDHWDNDNHNENANNLHLLCRSMNAVKNPRGRGLKNKILSSMRVNGNEQENLNSRLKSAELTKNERTEPTFRHYLFAEVSRHGRVKLEDIIDEGAAYADCSQETIRRYLRKEKTKLRPYQIVEDPIDKEKYVEFKPEWNTFRQKQEARKLLNEQANNWKEDMKLELGIAGKTGEVKP